MTKEDSLILWLQHWFYENCDGDWEHDQKITITIIDNPGWAINIKLSGTIMENEIFQDVFIEKNETHWCCCRIENNVFLGDCGPLNLIDMIGVFKSWVDSKT